MESYMQKLNYLTVCIIFVILNIKKYHSNNLLRNEELPGQFENTTLLS